MRAGRHIASLRGFLAVGLCVLAFSSCVHRSPFKDEHYFQVLGDPGQIVITADSRTVSKLPISFEAIDPTFASLLARVDRLSVELYDPDHTERDDQVLDAQVLSSYRFRGALEGNIPAFLTNSMLLWDDGWDQVSVGSGMRYYRNEWLGLEVYAPKNGILLFANEDYLDHYRKSYKERVTRIPRALADRMANSLFGFYVGSPQAMIDVGLAIPKSVLLQSESIVLVIEETSERPVLGGIITMKSDRLANSLSILLKSSYISDKRRKKEPLGDLTNLFVLEGDAVYINGMTLTDEQLASFSAMFGSLASISTGENR